VSEKDPGSEAELIGAGAEGFENRKKAADAAKALAPYAQPEARMRAKPSWLGVILGTAALTMAGNYLLRPSGTVVAPKPAPQTESRAPAPAAQTATAPATAEAPPLPAEPAAPAAPAAPSNEFSKLSEEVSALRAQNDELRNALDASRRAALEEARAAGTAATQAAARLDKLEERLARLEKGPVDKTATAAIPRMAAPAEPAPSAAKAEAPATAKATEGALPAKPEPPTLRDRFSLRGVDDGAALIERKDGRFFEVEPGDVVPGAGRVLSISRRGRDWVVVTSKGVIERR